ncbi:MAG TPA: DUF4249 family protein [Anditalea sp.]|nr:DUF4249 family protein [Anditalea sp.]
MKRILYIAIFSLFISCVDEINLTTGGNEPKLVVDAWISNDPNLSYVKLYYSAPFQSGNNHLKFNIPAVNRIYVESEIQGRNFDYAPSYANPQSENLIYILRDNINFQAGESYRLNILLQDGNHYRSDWQKVAPSGEILNFEYDIIEKIIFRQWINTPPYQFLQLYLDIQAVIENPFQEEFGYYLKASGIEELMTQSRNEFCQCVCYLDIPNINDGMNVASVSGISGSNIKHSIGNITMGRIFRHYINLNLYTTTAEGALFLEKIQEQQKNTGSIFDPMPFKIKGNIKNLNDESEEVLGYFFTAHHTQKDDLVQRAEFFTRYRHLNFNLDVLDSVGQNCREIYPEAVNFPPPQFR